MMIKTNVPPSPEKQELKTEWVSIFIASILSLLCSVQFTIYFSSLWPYLQEIDMSITEEFFGYITAVYSLGQCIAMPVFGWWANKIGQCKLPIQTGLVIMVLGNLLYLMIPLTAYSPKWIMMISRFFTGLGGGIIAVLRTYASQASLPKDRSRSISLNTGSFALGLTAGPALQLLFTPLSYPGITLIDDLKVNIYSCPAVAGVVANLIGLVIVSFIFRESSVGIQKIEKAENENHDRFFALPSADLIAVFICIFTRFAMMFVITNIETIGSPLSMTMFNWTAEEAVFYNSIQHASSAIVSFCVYATNTIWNVSKSVDNRHGCIVGLLSLVVFHLLTYPWWFIDEKIDYQQEFLIVNGTSIPNPHPVGCRPTFEWCAHVPKINVYIYVVTYVICSGLGFSLINITMNTVFSMVLGPKPQGTMTGFLMLSGSVARLCGPIFVSSLFAQTGPSIPWLIEIAIAGAAVLMWIFFYSRMVPMKHGNALKAGDTYKNKHGLVYKM